MSSLVEKIPLPLNQWDKNSIRPGPVGSVGDCLTSVRIKQSSPDMDFAYSKTFSPKNDVLRGSNVQDGQWFSFSDGGYNAQVKRRKMNNGVAFKSSVGWIHQDIVAPEKYVEPKVAPQGRVGWQTQEAAILHRSGDMFQELPGGYSAPAGVLPRGNMYPRPVTVGEADPSKRLDFSTPVEPKPTTSQLLRGVVNNLLPTPLNNVVSAPTYLNPYSRQNAWALANDINYVP